jgi:hypothetical protein
MWLHCCTAGFKKEAVRLQSPRREERGTAPPEGKPAVLLGGDVLGSNFF